MSFTLPQALVLLLPLGLFLWKRGQRPGPPMVLRWALLLLGVGALAGPELVLRDAGSDVVVVVDRSRSMPPDAGRVASELIGLLETQRRTGDRVGVLSFGREARVEQPLSELGRFGGFTRPVEGEASEVGAALDAAGALIPPGRTGRVLVVSDGRATGPDARGAARRYLGKRIRLRYTPELDFKYDEAPERGGRIEAILEGVLPKGAGEDTGAPRDDDDERDNES